MISREKVTLSLLHSARKLVTRTCERSRDKKRCIVYHVCSIVDLQITAFLAKLSLLTMRWCVRESRPIDRPFRAFHFFYYVSRVIVVINNQCRMPAPQLLKRDWQKDHVYLVQFPRMGCTLNSWSIIASRARNTGHLFSISHVVSCLSGEIVYRVKRRHTSRCEWYEQWRGGFIISQYLS